MRLSRCWRLCAAAAGGQRVALVTGAGSGIGRALALALAQRGILVVGAGRRSTALDGTRELLKKSGNYKMFPVAADVASPEGRKQVQAALAEAAAEAARPGHLDFLIHNAGILGEVGDWQDVTPEGHQLVQAVNVEAPLFLTQLLTPSLEAAQGRVLHISTGAAHRAISGWLSYCVSKAALLKLMRCLDLELSNKGVRVGSVIPGVVDTEMQDELRKSDFPSVQRFQALKANAPQDAWSSASKPPPGGLDRPENVADFLTWLLLEIDANEFGGREWGITIPDDRARWLYARETQGRAASPQKDFVI